MLKPSQSGLFEVHMEVLVEGDCVTRSRIHNHLIAVCHSLAEANAAADAAANKCGDAGFCLRYPAAFARVHNTLRQRKAARLHAAAVADDDAPF